MENQSIESSAIKVAIQERKDYSTQTSFIEENTPRRDVPGLSDLLKRDDVSVESLPQSFSTKVDTLFESIEESNSFGSIRQYQELDFLYQYWAATRGLSEEHPLSEFAKSLSGFDIFFSTYGANRTAFSRGKFMNWMQPFIFNVIHPQRYLEVYPSEFQEYMNVSMGIYNYQGEWIEIWESQDPWEHKYVTREVVQEISELVNDDIPSVDLFHTSASTALPGIARQKAIISAREGNKRGEDVKTGEHVSYITENGSSFTSGRKGHKEVYAAKGSPQLGYATLRWFDEYPVVFGIASEKMRKYMLDQGFDEEDIDFIGWSTEGITLGEHVSLDIIDVIYGYSVNTAELRKWTVANCPHVKVVSLEAREIVERNSDRRFQERNKVMDWNALLRSKSYTLVRQ